MSQNKLSQEKSRISQEGFTWTIMKLCQLIDEQDYEDSTCSEVLQHQVLPKFVP